LIEVKDFFSSVLLVKYHYNGFVLGNFFFLSLSCNRTLFILFYVWKLLFPKHLFSFIFPHVYLKQNVICF